MASINDRIPSLPIPLLLIIKVNFCRLLIEPIPSPIEMAPLLPILSDCIVIYSSYRVYRHFNDYPKATAPNGPTAVPGLIYII